MPAQQSSTNSLVPQYWGQLALLFPIVSYIASSHMFEKQTAEQIPRNPKKEEDIFLLLKHHMESDVVSVFSSFWGVVMRSIPG